MADSTTKQSFTEEEKRYARALMAALEPFREIRSTMPLQYLYTFLLVVLEEGKTVNEYATKAGVSNTVMTRHLLDIGERNRDKEEGFGLIMQERDMYDLRKHLAKLTAKGKTKMHQIIRALDTVAKK